MPDAYAYDYYLDPGFKRKSGYIVVLNANSHRRCAGCFGPLDKGEEVCGVPMSNSKGDRWYTFMHNHLGCLARLRDRVYD